MEGGVPLPPGIPGLGGSTDPLEAILGTFPCVRLKNLPFDTTLEDILVFFQGLVVLDVLLVGEGEAFVIFSNPMDYQMALQRKSRQTIRRSHIDVDAATRAEYYEAIGKQQLEELRRSGRLSRERGGAYSGDERSSSDRSKIDWGSGLGSGSAELDSLGVQHGHGAMGLGMMLGSNAGVVGLGGGRGRPGSQPVRRTGGGIQVGEHTGYLRMRGLPFSSTREEIYRFFEGFNPVEDSIVLTYRSDGRATGEAYVGFASPDDSLRAMALHRKSMGSRYIELFISNKEEHGRAMQRHGNR